MDETDEKALDPGPEEGESPRHPPLYAAALVLVHLHSGDVGHVGAAVQVDDVFIAFDPVDRLVSTTPRGRAVGYAIVDPMDYAHLHLERVLRQANSGTGQTPQGLRVTLITVPKPMVDPLTYAREYEANKSLLVE